MFGRFGANFGAGPGRGISGRKMAGPEAVTVSVFAAALPPWGAAFDGRMALSMPLTAKSGIFPGKFWRNEFFRLYLQSRNESFGIFAEIAQLVERNLAKVEGAGPSPVFRSKETSDNQ